MRLMITVHVAPKIPLKYELCTGASSARKMLHSDTLHSGKRVSTDSKTYVAFSKKRKNILVTTESNKEPICSTVPYQQFPCNTDKKRITSSRLCIGNQGSSSSFLRGRDCKLLRLFFIDNLRWNNRDYQFIQDL
jgi:hypothetical protein